MRGFSYSQRDGTIAVVNGDWFAPLFAGSAGREAGRNSPAHQCEKNVGPLPVGDYRMRIVDHPRFASPAIRLDPIGTPEGATRPHMCGRSGFYIHGDNARGDFSASNGCIVLGRSCRDTIDHLVRWSGVRTLIAR